MNQSGLEAVLSNNQLLIRWCLISK
jgi:hypothetical protein